MDPLTRVREHFAESIATKQTAADALTEVSLNLNAGYLTLVGRRAADAEPDKGIRWDVGLPDGKEVLIYCANGIRAEMAHQTLDQAGIANRYLNETVNINKDGSFKI